MEKELTIEHINAATMLGVALKRHRKSKGLSQDQLAKNINMRQATISDLENGRGTLESLFKVIQILKVNLVLSNRRGINTSTKDIIEQEIIDLL